MQQVLIINRLIPERDPGGALGSISGVTHDGQAIRFEGSEAQRINLHSLEFQQTPLLLLTDRVFQPFSDVWLVPADALIAIVPMPSDQIKQLLEQGEGESLIAAVRDQLSADAGKE